MRIAVTSDTHLGASDMTTHKQLRALFEKIAADSPDVLVHAGDYNGGFLGYKKVRSTVRLAREVLGRDLPFLSVIGNHDYWVLGGRDYDSHERLNPQVRHWQKNLRKIEEIFKEYGVHFLDEDGPARFEECTFVGHSLWYENAPYGVTNDELFLPKRVDGVEIHRYLKERNFAKSSANLALLRNTDRNRIFVSHMAVVNPEGQPPGEFAIRNVDESYGAMLQRDFDIKYFINGHCHERHEGPQRIEAGSDYGSPRHVLMEI